jgi:hypothetical protein
MDAVPDPVEYLRATKMLSDPRQWLWGKLMDKFGKGLAKMDIWAIPGKTKQATIFVYMDWYRKLEQPEVEAIAQFVKDHTHRPTSYQFGEVNGTYMLNVISGAGFNEPKLIRLFFDPERGRRPMIDGILHDALPRPGAPWVGWEEKPENTMESRASLIVATLLEDRLDEILDAINFWLDPKGKEHVCQNHVDWACQYLKIKLASPKAGTGYWEAQGRVYQQMFSRGWVRIAFLPQQHEIMVDYHRANAEQWDWMMEKAIATDSKLIDDRGRILFDPAESEILGGPIEPPQG